MNYTEISDLILDNLKRIIFPEEWLKIDLTFSKQEIFTLMLVERKGEIIMSQIAEYVNVPMSTATGIVDRLVKNGYLERNRSDSDRRIVLIKLTDKAKTVVNEIKNLGSKYFSIIYESLSDEERAFLSKIITKVINSINKQESVDKKEEFSESQIRKIEIE